MKKIIVFVFILILSFLFPIFSSSADIGPKRTLEIEVIGVDEPYFLELLEKGTISPEIIEDYQNDLEMEFPEILLTYTENGYVSSRFVRPWGYFPIQTSLNNYRHSYNPPSEFKIILIFEDGRIVTSNVIKTTLFNSKVTYDLSNVNIEESRYNTGAIEEILPVSTMVLELSSRIILTIGIEIIVLFLFGYVSKKSFLFVTYVNLFTQVTLTVFMFLMRYYYFPGIGELFVLFVGEIFIFGFEIIVYAKYLKEHSPKRAALYGLVANIFSLIAGFSLMILYLSIL
jgi:hypothetical protein